MSDKKNVSVVVSTYNSEEKIERCLRSVSWASEIIVVDGTSADKTIGLAKKYTNKIFTRPNNKMLNINKNFGFSKASGDWILSIDSDEEVSAELKDEILALDLGSDIDGYWIPRKNIIFGKWIKHTGWYPDHQLRFFKKLKGKFPEEHVHEMVAVDGKVGYLNKGIIHNSYESISQFTNKIFNIYAPNEAEQLIKNGYIFNWKDVIRFPAKEFLSRFFAREGYRDGFHGLMLSLLMSFYHLIVFSYIWEKNKFRQLDNVEILKETESEFKQSTKDIFFWFSKEKLKLIDNPLKRLVRKFLNKLE